MTPRRQRLIEHLQLRGLSERTQEMYVGPCAHWRPISTNPLTRSRRKHGVTLFSP
jgi:hypothetical protein